VNSISWSCDQLSQLTKEDTDGNSGTGSGTSPDDLSIVRQQWTLDKMMNTGAVGTLDQLNSCGSICTVHSFAHAKDSVASNLRNCDQLP